MTQLLRTLTLALATSVAAGATANAQTGVSDNRVSLPDGVGSLEGIGDDASVTGNMGAMSYRVDMPVPGGFEGVTPTLGLAYSSTSGPAEAGVGWSFDTPSIERLTVRGVPDYDVDDEFVGESGQLVYVSGTNPRAYRSRFEGAFIRYRWYDAGDGAGGYWTAEYPDGRVGYFGADAESDTVAAARVGGDDGVFRYQLVDMVDVYGHRMTYTWTDVGSTSLLSQVGWVFDGDTPRYTAALSWDDRDDVVINATGGFVEVLEHRLAEVEVFSSGTSIDRWALTYDDMDASGGISRLAQVERFGLGDAPFPVVPQWSYSAALGADCDGDCARPVVYGMGTLGVNLASGDPQLIDINGDALPDIVDSTLVGSPHRIFENVLAADGTQAFASARDSATGTQDGFDFSNGRVQVLDVNGDGFTDVVNMATGSVLTNEGLGDWVDDATAGDVGALPDFDNPANLVAMRFIDIDNDRRIDLVRASGSGDSHVTRVYRNTDAGFVEVDDAEAIGFGFDAGTMEVNDINGDGLVDVARVTASGVAYRLNIGHGRWWPVDDWAMAEFTDAGLEASELETAELDDLNGDGLADVSLVRGTTVEVWINRAGASLVPIDPITESDVDAVDGAEIPARTGNTTVLVADMNANGSSDIVWVTESGEVTVMDLFPVRPNLLTRVDNGLGGVIDVMYGTSAAERARDADAGAAWAHPMPMPHLVVTGMVRSDDLGSVPVELRYAYHDGFYDGVEKAFRGYAQVVETRVGDEVQAGSVTTSTWSTGVDDPYEAGAALGAAITSEAGDAMTTTTSTYADCPLEVDDSGLLFDIRYWCVVQQDVVEQDGADAADWRTIRTTMAYDGWGQVTTETQHGVVAIGGADCGADCEGDEFETRTTYVEPGADTDGRWILGRPSRVAGYGGPDLDVLAFETAYRYDGDAFEGLPEGELTHGGLTRELRWLDDRWVDAARNRLDEHGHVTESLDALGEPGGDGHRVRTEWDALGLRPVATEFEVDATTTLRREYTYDAVRGQVESISNWYRPSTADAQVFSTATYDAFGRAEAQVMPGGDTVASPTVRTVYDLSSGGSAVTVFGRAEAGSAETFETRTCFDGFGRPTETRQALGDGRWLVRDRRVYGATGQLAVEYGPYETSANACGDDAPDDAERVISTRDALGRVVATTRGSADLTRERQMRFAPGVVHTYESGDLDPSAPGFDTPVIERADGLGRIVEVGRRAAAGDPLDTWSVTWSPAGHLAAVEGPNGDRREQTYDTLGRVVSSWDADRGLTEWDYDDRSLMIAETDPTGTVRQAYDGAGRLVERWVDGARDATLHTWVWDASDDCPDQRCTFAANLVVAETYPTTLGAGVDWLGYDVLGRVVWSQRNIGATSMDRTWAFDQLGRVSTMGFPGGRELTYRWDAALRLAGIDGILDGVTFDVRGDTAEARFANGVTTAFDRDGLGRLASMRIDGNGAIHLDRAWEYDADDRVTAVLDALADGATPSAEARYTYDGFGRLIEAELDGSNALAETLTFSYDAIDNLLARTSSLGEASPAHDANRVLHAERPHGLASYAGGAVEYDGAGRVTRRGDLVTSWSGFGRLAEVETSAGLRITFEDSGEERVLEHDSDGGRAILFGADFALEDGVASILPQIGDVSTARIEYVDVATLGWADLAPVAIDGDGFTSTPDGAISAADAWVAYASDRDLLAGIETTETAEALLTASAAQGLHGFGDRTTWLHRGHGAHLLAVTDEDGALVERPIEYPFGLRRDATNGAPDAMRLSDQREHVEAELVSFPLRIYDPMMGRWLRPDGFFAPLTPLHLRRPWEATGAYSYVQNDPINGYDPTGAVDTPGGTATSMDGESMYDPPDGPATPETPGGGAQGPSAAEVRARLVGLADAGGVAMAAAGGRGPGADGNLDLEDDVAQIGEIEGVGEGQVGEADVVIEPGNGGGGADEIANMMNEIMQVSATPGGGPAAPAAQARPRPPRPVQPPMGGGGLAAPAAGPVIGLAALSARFAAPGSIHDASIQQSQSRIISMNQQVNIGNANAPARPNMARRLLRSFAYHVGARRTR